MRGKEKGITLIALVVTIIILLILAGVTIRWVTTGDSIFKYADIAKKETKRGEIIEYLDLTLVDEQTEGYKETVETIIKNTQKRVKANGKSDLSAIAKEVETREVETKKYNEKDAEYYFYVVVDEEVYKVGANGAEYIGRKSSEEIEIQEGEIKFEYSKSELTNENIKVIIINKTNIEGATITYRTTGEKDVAEEESNQWKEYNGEIEIEKNCSIFAKVSGITGEIKTATGNVENIDKLAPKEFSPESKVTTTNSITVTANTDDQEKTEDYAESGIAGYSFKIDEEDWTAYQKEGEYTFEKLIQGTEHTIKVKAKDVAGNETNASSDITAITDTMISAKEEGNITFEGLPQDWTNKNVTVTAKTTSSYKIQTSTDKTNWEDKASQELEKNGKVYARLVDSTGQYAEGESWATAEVTRIDKLAPNELNPESKVTTNSITVTANTDDHEKTEDYAKSGLVGYSFKIDKEDWTAYQKEGEYTFEKLTQGTEHTIKVKAKDEAGNETSELLEMKLSTQDMVGAEDGNLTLKYSETTWTNKDVIVTAENKTNYYVEMSTDKQNWKRETSHTMKSNGNIYARLVDATNQYKENSYATGEVTIIDKENPNVPTVTLNLASNNGNYTSNTWTNQNVKVTFSATDNGDSGIASYEYSTNKNNPTAKTSPFTVSTDGTTNIYIRAIDRAKNKSEWSELKVVKRDATAPTVNFQGTANGATNVSLSISVSEKQSKLYYAWTNSDSLPGSWSEGTNGTYSENRSITTAGKYYFWVKDEANNVVKSIADVTKSHTHSTSCYVQKEGIYRFSHTVEHGTGQGLTMAYAYCDLCGTTGTWTYEYPQYSKDGKHHCYKTVLDCGLNENFGLNTTTEKVN